MRSGKVKKVEVVKLDPSKVKLGWRARQDLGGIKCLAKSILQVGQLQPILVEKKRAGYTLIAGLRRLRACESLGRRVDARVVEPRDRLHELVMQLSENMKRKGLDKLEMAEGLKRYKEEYIAAYPETRHGGAGRGRVRGHAVRFSAAASEALAISEQAVNELLLVADLPTQTKTKIRQSTRSVRDRNAETARALVKFRGRKRRASCVELQQELRTIRALLHAVLEHAGLHSVGIPRSKLIRIRAGADNISIVEDKHTDEIRVVWGSMVDTSGDNRKEAMVIDWKF